MKLIEKKREDYIIFARNGNRSAAYITNWPIDELRKNDVKVSHTFTIEEFLKCKEDSSNILLLKRTASMPIMREICDNYRDLDDFTRIGSILESNNLKEATQLTYKDQYKPFLQTIQSKDDLVYAWHGTNTFWCLYFCMYGVDADVEPPTKTLGRGSMSTGFSKIKSNGLFVSAEKTSGFLHYVKFEVKPSELGISLEMAERGHKEEDVLTTLVLGDCIIIEPLKSKRIAEIVSNNVSYSREEFISLFPDPKKYLRDNYKVNFYNDDNPIRRKFMKQMLIDELKDEINSAYFRKEDILYFIKDLNRSSDTQLIMTYGLHRKDADDIIDWLESKLTI